MLCLAMKTAETLVMAIPPSAEPREITIQVLRGHCTQRWGITADRDVNVVRGEVLRAKREAGERAATHDGRGRECDR